MGVSAFKSFLDFLRMKARMAGSSSKRLLAIGLFLAVFLISAAATIGVTFTGRQASAQITPAVTIGTEAIHITTADGTKSLSRLIAEQSSTGALPSDLRILNMHFITDPSSSGSLIFTKAGQNNPVGWQLAIAPGRDIKMSFPVGTTAAAALLENYLVRTTQISNVLIIIQYLPMFSTT